MFENFKDKKILITGGRGFVGYNLALKLKSLGAKVTITEHATASISGLYNEDDFQVIPCDLLKKKDCDYVVRYGEDYVFHCAAVSHGAEIIKKDPMSMIIPTTIMNTLMLDASYKNNVNNFVFISSSVVYKDTGDTPVKESDIDGEPPYVYKHVCAMKRYFEKLCECYHDLCKMKCYVIRPGNLYGEYDNFDPGLSHVTAALIRKIVEHQDPLEIWGDGNDVRDILYIKDFVDMTLQAVEKIKVFEPINISYGEGYDIKEILEFLNKIEHFWPKIIYNSNKPSMIPVREINTDKAISMGIKPSLHLSNGLARTVAWYKECR